MKKILTYVLLVLAVQNLQAIEVDIYTIEIPKINTKNKSSSYNKLLKLIEKNSGDSFKLTYFPQTRALKKFKQNSIACFFPYSKIDGREVNDYLLSKSVADLEFYAINLKNKEKVNKSNKLTRVGLKSFYRENFIFPANIKAHYVETDEQLLFMLDSNRVDYIIESVPDIYLVFKTVSDFDKKYHFDQSFKYAIVRDYFACHKNNEHGKKMIDSINLSL